MKKSQLRKTIKKILQEMAPGQGAIGPRVTHSQKKLSKKQKYYREMALSSTQGAVREQERPSPPRSLRLPQYSEEELTNIVKGFKNENQFKAWYDREFGPWLQYVPEIPSADELIRSVPDPMYSKE